jgi:hypothetical protein
VRGRIPQARLLRYIEEASKVSSIRLVVFSGGECFLLGQDLAEAVGRASSLGMLTRCVSNGFWARSARTARARLQPLVDAGLNEINFSTGDEHQEWVPIERVAVGTSVALRMGLTVAIAVERHREGHFTLEHLVSNPALAEVLSDPELRRRLRLLQSPWITEDTVGADQMQNQQSGINKNNLIYGGCNSVLSTLVISPSEYLAACCGLTHEQIPEMRLGSLREHSLADLIAEGKSDFLKLWLMIEGPLRILSWAAEKDPTIQWEGLYRHHCDACRAIYTDHRVRQAIEKHYSEKIVDVVFRFTVLDRARLGILRRAIS